jgi:hypothetical protein
MRNSESWNVNVHYYALHLGRWLDCTDASRQFTLKIPALATTSPVLLEAIMSFAARHAGDTEAANLAHGRCIAMLIVQLDSGRVADDDALLCAIVILRVFEQLTVQRPAPGLPGALRGPIRTQTARGRLLGLHGPVSLQRVHQPPGPQCRLHSDPATHPRPRCCCACPSLRDGLG